MAQLHETIYGKRFFEYELPELNRNLKKIAEAMLQLTETLKPKSTQQSPITSHSTPIRNDSPLFTNVPGMTQKMVDFMNKCFENQNTTIDADNNADNIKILSSIKLKDIFSIRIVNSLLNCRNPKTNLYQLVISPERELMGIKNFGAKCLWEVKQYLSLYGLDIDMANEEILKSDLQEMRKAVALNQQLISHSRFINGVGY